MTWFRRRPKQPQLKMMAVSSRSASDIARQAARLKVATCEECGGLLMTAHALTCGRTETVS